MLDADDQSVVPGFCCGLEQCDAIGNSGERIGDRARCVVAGAGDVRRSGVCAAEQMADDLAFAENVQAIRGEEPVAAQLLLHAERELLEERVMRVWRDGDDAHSAGLCWAAEWRGQGGAAGSENAAWAKHKPRLGWAARDRAAKVHSEPAILRHRQRAVVLNALFAPDFEDDSIVVDAVAATNHRLTFSEGIVSEADARSEVFLVGRLMQIDYVRHPDARLRWLDGQARAGVGIAVRSGEVGIVFPAQAEIQREARSGAPVVLHVAGDVVVEHQCGIGTGTTGALLLTPQRRECRDR